MAMPEQVIPITGLDTVGLIEDVPPVSLPPAAFSDCRNVRFRDGTVSKMGGDIDILPHISVGEQDVFKYIVWWPNPNLAFENLGYYLLIIEQNDNDNAYLIKVDEAGTIDSPLELTTSSENFKGTFEPSDFWQHTFFQGGFALIINSGLEAPHYILDSEENTETANVDNFAALPNWESYAADLATLEGYTDVANLTVTAGVIRSYGDFLVAGNFVERGDTTDSGGTVLTNQVIRSLPNIIRSSDIAAPGDIPQNWNPFATAVNTADEFVVTGDGVVQDFVELQGNMYIYSNSSISVMSRTGNPSTPLSVRPVTAAYGALTTDSVIEFDGRHFVVGSQDIYIFGGHPGSIQSVSDSKVREAFYQRLNTLDIHNLFVLRYRQKDEIWLCYPSQTATGGRADEALIWNYRNNTWTKRDLQGVISGTIGPILGGGLPRAEVGFSTTAPTANAVTSGSEHVNTLASSTDIVMQGTGNAHEFTISVPDTLPQHVATGNPVYKLKFLEDFYTGGDDCPTLRFVAKATEDNDLVLNIQLNLPEHIGINPDNPAFNYDTSEYRTSVTDAIYNHLLSHVHISESDTTHLTLHQALDEDFNTAFLIEFQDSISSDPFATLLEILKLRVITDESDLDEDDRPVDSSLANDNSIDVIGHQIMDSSFPADGEVYSFDFAHIIDDIEDYVFFFKGVQNPFVQGEYATYGDLPSDAEVFTGTTTGMSGTTESGGQRSQSGMSSPDMDGHRRVNVDFSSPTEIFDPWFGSDILDLINSNSIDSTEVALLINAADVINDFNLIAYRIPKESNGNPSHEQGSATVAGEEEASTLTFNIYQAEYNKSTDSWVASDVVIPPVVAILAFNGGGFTEGTDDFGTAQRKAFREIITTAFLESEVFTATESNNVITAVSNHNRAYIIDINLEGGELVNGGTPVLSSFSPDETSVQGTYDFTNGTPTDDQRKVVAPCIRVVHNDPDIEFFSFDTGLIELVRDDGDNTTLTPTDWLQLVDDAIQETVPNQWEYTGVGEWTSTEVTYDESQGDTGVPHPNSDGTYTFPAERRHSNFVISFFSQGSSNTISAPTSTEAEGSYPSIDLGSHYVMNLSSGISYLFYIGAQTLTNIGDYLKEEIERRVPELQVLSSGSTITVEPAVIGENSVFVLESYVNLEDSIDDFRRLLDPDNFEQDDENPQVQLDLPDSVLMPLSDDFPFAAGPSLDQFIATNFDLVRTWSETQVNYSVEFPIFVAGVTFHNGNTDNKILAGDIGFTIPIFSETTSGVTGYESYVERVQVAMSPEFDTESLQSIALWTDGSSLDSFGGELRYNVLQLNLTSTNNPGQLVDLTNPQYINTHYISEDYKMDTRITGRFFNWRLSDEVDMDLDSPNGKLFSQQSDWRLSGLQFKLRPSGRR